MTDALKDIHKVALKYLSFNDGNDAFSGKTSYLLVPVQIKSCLKKKKKATLFIHVAAIKKKKAKFCILNTLVTYRIR